MTLPSTWWMRADPSALASLEVQVSEDRQLGSRPCGKDARGQRTTCFSSRCLPAFGECPACPCLRRRCTSVRPSSAGRDLRWRPCRASEVQRCRPEEFRRSRNVSSTKTRGRVDMRLTLSVWKTCRGTRRIISLWRRAEKVERGRAHLVSSSLTLDDDRGSLVGGEVGDVPQMDDPSVRTLISPPSQVRPYSQEGHNLLLAVVRLHR